MKSKLYKALLILIFGAGSFSCSSSSTADVAKKSPEEMLVSVDTGKQPSSDDANVKRVRFLLDYLAENTTSSRYEIADTASRTAEIIEKKYGKKYTGQEVLEAGRKIVEAMPKNRQKDDFKAVAAVITMEASTK